MAIVPLNGLGDVGLVTDREPHELPFNAWSSARNVRFVDGAVEKFLGHRLMTPASVVPHWLLAARRDFVYYWIYAGLQKVFAYEGTGHFNITRQSAGVDVNYTGNAGVGWTGGIIGGIPILNNGVDAPQMWNPVATTQRLQALSNWPANTSCNVMRPFKNFLVALDVIKGANRFPKLVKWSHPTATGAVPSSWDETDPTKDAGEYELGETDDACIDSLPLRNVNLIYREQSVWGMQLGAADSIFSFAPIFREFGAVSRRCVAPMRFAKHVVFTGDDIVVHDGQSADSVLKGRMGTFLRTVLDSTNFTRSFVVHHPSKYEVWTCIPMTGQVEPNLAFVWEYKENKIGTRELPSTNFIAPGIALGQSTADLWDFDPGTWDSDPTLWDENTFNPSQQKLVMATQAGQLLEADQTNAFLSTNMTAFVERTGIPLPLKVNLPPDFSTIKFIRRLWPRIQGPTGGLIKISVGYQDKIRGPLTWGLQKNFIIGQDDYVDPRISGRLLAVRFESATAIDWRLTGYEMDVVALGSR